MHSMPFMEEEATIAKSCNMKETTQVRNRRDCVGQPLLHRGGCEELRGGGKGCRRGRGPAAELLWLCARG